MRPGATGRIEGLGGDDTITGLGGYNVLRGGDGSDVPAAPYLLVDGNGDGAYSAGQDYVLELASPAAALPGTAEFFL